jgi:hypothetical protein
LRSMAELTGNASSAASSAGSSYGLQGTSLMVYFNS